jgi:hypothetical protein
MIDIEELLKSLVEFSIPTTEEELREGSTVIIEAESYLRHIIKRNNRLKMHLALGEFGLLRSLVTEDITLFVRCKLKIFFIFGCGNSVQFDNEVRMNEQEESDNLIAACRQGYSKKVLPLAPLATAQLKDTLLEFGVKVYELFGDAASFISSMCSDYNASLEIGRERCFCLASRRCDCV